MEKQSILQKSKSALISKKIYIERMTFCRNKHDGEIIKFDESSIGKSVEAIDNDIYKCSLILEMEDTKNKADLEVVVSGIFELKLEEDEAFKKAIITKNTMAILFPYLRAQVTLLTAQPDVEVVVIPPININALLDNWEEEQNNLAES